MNQQKIDRINELYRKSKAKGLTEAERTEQNMLRMEFIANVRNNLKSQLESIDLVNPDGTIENLGRKYGAEKTDAKTTDAKATDAKATDAKTTN